MENATKALLIAAAVLVAILIISLGIGIFNMASEQVDNAGDLSEYQIQQFNDKFKKYEGTNVSGSDVNAMINTVFNHNLAQPDTSTQISIATSGSVIGFSGLSTGSTTTSPGRVSTGQRYTVVATYDAESKLITTITISQN